MQDNNTTGLQNSGTETQLQQVLAHLQMHSLEGATEIFTNHSLTRTKINGRDIVVS